MAEPKRHMDVTRGACFGKHPPTRSYTKVRCLIIDRWDQDYPGLSVSV